MSSVCSVYHIKSREKIGHVKAHMSQHYTTLCKYNLSHVMPILEYCDAVGHSCGVCNNTSSEKCQRHVAMM